jgi:ribulose-phosphate 3-epimerase
MKIELGVKSDPIEYRYSYEWLFDLMRRGEVRNLQLGSFTELYFLPDEFFLDLRQTADSYGICPKSVFTSHRELGGAFTGNPHLERVARRNYERLLEIAAVLGADYCGSNPGAVYRDRPDSKADGIRRWLDMAKELMHKAHTLHLKAMTLEPMSCSAEPPTTPEEIRSMITELTDYHATHPDSTVPFYLCTDLAHGYAGRDGRVVHSNLELFEYAVPWTAEFHIKNTDERFDSTFGFAPENVERGIVDLTEVRDLIERNEARWPVDDLVGYLEIGGPKLGRDYSDHLLEHQLSESLARIRRDFGALVGSTAAV